MSRRTNKNPVGDSTRGRSPVINPKTFKGDVLTQTWMDSRVLATLSIWIESRGKETRFLSEVIKHSLSTLAEFLVDNGEVELVDNTVEAREYLQDKYKIKLNAGNRGRKNQQHNVLLSSMKKGSMPVSLGSSLVNAEPKTYVGGRKREKTEEEKSDREKAIDDFFREKEKEDQARYRERISQLPKDSNGNIIVENTYNNDYTEEDRVKDLIARARKESEASKVDELPDDQPSDHRPLSEEELDERDRKRAEKEKAERDAWASMAPPKAAE